MYVITFYYRYLCCHWIVCTSLCGSEDIQPTLLFSSLNKKKWAKIWDYFYLNRTDYLSEIEKISEMFKFNKWPIFYTFQQLIIIIIIFINRNAVLFSSLKIFTKYFLWFRSLAFVSESFSTLRTFLKLSLYFQLSLDLMDWIRWQQ